MTDHGPQSLSVEVTLGDIETLFTAAIAADSRTDPGYIVEKLAKTRSPDDAFRIQCVERAGCMLRTLHDAVKFEQVSRNQTGSYDSSLLLGLYKVLDFLILEGMYPSVQPGTGRISELRAKSLFYTKHDSAYLPLHGSNQLDLVLNHIFEPILKDVDSGLEPLVRHRNLADIITGYANLSHQNGREAIPSSFIVYLEKLPTSSLFTAYTALLQSSNVEWFRSLISLQLSVLPLRVNGVRSTIDFLAAAHRLPQAQPDHHSPMPSIGPAISIEALHQASKLLSSVPRSMSPDSFFSEIAPQLLELIDHQAEPAMQRAAAYIIGNGILGKRSIGTPNTVGWTLFALPIAETINSSLSDLNHTGKLDVLYNPAAATTSAPPLGLHLALTRMSTLVFSHPNPGLTGRLIRPLLLPLWALANHSDTSSLGVEASRICLALLSHFLRLVGTTASVIHLADNILYGILSQDADDANSLRPSYLASGVDPTADLEDNMMRIDKRIQTFCSLLVSGKVSDVSVLGLFTDFFDKQANEQSLSDEPTVDQSFKALALVNLLQSLVEKFGNQLAKDPEHMIELVIKVLRYNVDGRSLGSRGPKSLKPSMSNLASIAQPAENIAELSRTLSGLNDALMLALSLLNAVVLREDHDRQARMLPDLSRIRELLMALLRVAELEKPILLQVETTLALLNVKSSDGAISSLNTASETALDVQRTLALITTDIASDLPPIKRSALHALQTLIKSPDAPLEVPPLVLLVLGVIRTDTEEFVYLAAVQTVVQLAVRRNLGYVSRQLVDSFQDTNEQTGIDGRLRVGEALANLADELGSDEYNITNQGDVVQSMAKALLAIAGRRGNRKREQLERQRAERLQHLKIKEAERAWGGEVPEVPIDIEEGSEEHSLLSIADGDKHIRDLEVIDSIVRGWENTGVEEDMRVRASSLSILYRLFENCGVALKNAETPITTGTIEICLSILTLELEPAHTILRRAAALALFGILKGVDAQLEDGYSSKTSGSLMNGEDWLKVEKVLKWVIDTEEDALIVGHCEAVLEGVEAVRMKLIARVVEAGSKPQDLEGNLRGLNVNSRVRTRQANQAGVKRTPVIEEVE